MKAFIPWKTFYRKNRRTVMAASCFLAIVLIFTVVNSPRIVGVYATTRLLPIYSVERDNKAVSLTFDAAWGDVRVR